MYLYDFPTLLNSADLRVVYLSHKMNESLHGNYWFSSDCLLGSTALIWLRDTDDVGEELEEMRSEAEKQKRMQKVRIHHGCLNNSSG